MRACLFFLSIAATVACARADPPKVARDPVASVKAPSLSSSSKPPPSSSDYVIDGLLHCAPPSNTNGSTISLCSDPAFPDACTLVAKSPYTLEQLQRAVWGHDVVDAGRPGLPTGPLSDARCYAAGPQTALNVMNWCCRPPNK